MLLNELFSGAPAIDIKVISADSRKAMPDGIFFCVKGLRTDGHQYVNEAIKNGAKAIVYQDDIDTSGKAVFIRVDDVLKVLNQVAKHFYGDPTKDMTIYGVTGTNGKTTIASVISDILGDTCGYIGTLGIKYGDIMVDADLTTPEVIDLNENLAKMHEHGIKACAIEASSTGIDQRRIDAVDFDVAIFTNLTHDHLDYHVTMDAYFKAKKRLFDRMPFGKVVVTNVDDSYGLDVVADTRARVITYGIENDADYMAYDIVMEDDGMQFRLRHGDKNYLVTTNLVATFNVYNLLAVIAALDQTGHDIDTFIHKLKDLKAIPGRMHKIDEGQDFNIIVDFAHTPDGLEKVFKYAQKITPTSRNIVAVFGSAGGRDKAKRKMFGELADAYCDKIVLTEDDPRDEDPVAIANQIGKGISRHQYIIVETREEAIKFALDMMNSGDTLLILGKGDEDFIYRSFGKEAYLGDDKVVSRYLRKMKEAMKDETS